MLLRYVNIVMSQFWDKKWKLCMRWCQSLKWKKYSVALVLALALGSNGFQFVAWQFWVYKLRCTIIRCKKKRWCVFVMAHIILLYRDSQTNVCSTHEVVKWVLFVYVVWVIDFLTPGTLAILNVKRVNCLKTKGFQWDINFAILYYTIMWNTSYFCTSIHILSNGGGRGRGFLAIRRESKWHMLS